MLFNIKPLCVCVRDMYMCVCAWMGMFVQVAVMKRSKKPAKKQRAEGEKDVPRNEHEERES